MTLLILGFAVVAMLLVMGTVVVTSAQLQRMRLLDAADGAALDAADSLDVAAYDRGLADAVAVNNQTVATTAQHYLASRPRPPGMLDWAVAPGTGAPTARPPWSGSSGAPTCPSSVACSGRSAAR